MNQAKSRNRLDQESSPYLLQHKDNPIHWYSWGEEAFRAAQDQGKPVFLSIGYSTCHWCHVMAHESFEDQEVAEMLNQNFIAIKVDREERPDVDDIYMTALQTISGGGGWPLSAWLTPSGKPFFAGTYFQKYRFLQLLRRIDEVWRQERVQIERDSEQLTEAIRNQNKFTAQEPIRDEYQELLDQYLQHFQYLFDQRHGGFGQAPKFPQTMNLMVMMRRDFATGLFQAEAMVKDTLWAMARGGIYDHLHGGFHRYSVDQEWLVPHFEKMLYDNALLAVTYLEAYQLYDEPEFARVSKETLNYVLTEMTDSQGGFYSAQDADSLNPETGHKEEGYFCTFSYTELEAGMTGAELERLRQVYGVSAAGDYEGRNVLHLLDDMDRRVKLEPVLVSALSKLRAMRAKRPLPHLDDKVITAWNGWMIWALLKGYEVLGDVAYLEAATKSLKFIYKNLWQDGVLYRCWRGGVRKVRATSEDYAAMIWASILISRFDANELWPEWALQLQSQLDDLFWDQAGGGYFLDDARDSLLIERVKPDYDGVSPCAQSMAALNCLYLYQLTGESRFEERALQLLQLFFARLKEAPSALPFMTLTVDFYLSRPAVLVGPGECASVDSTTEYAHPFAPWLLRVPSGSKWPVAAVKAIPPAANASSMKLSSAYSVCFAGECLPPAATFNEAWATIRKRWGIGSN